MAQDFSQEVYFCRDSSGKLDVSQALTKPHKLLTKSALGRDNSYFWLRVKLPNTNGKVFVELQSPYLNSVEGYLVKNTSVLRRFKVMSQNTPFSKRIFEHHNFVFPIDKRLNDFTDLYLRIHRKRLNVTAPIRIYNEADFMKYLRQKDRTYSLFNGFMVSLIILSISLYLFFREKTLLIYFGYLFGLVCTVNLAEGNFIQYFQSLDSLIKINNWRNFFNDLIVIFIFLLIRGLIWKGATHQKVFKIIFWTGVAPMIFSILLFFLEPWAEHFNITTSETIHLFPFLAFSLSMILSLSLVIISWVKSIQPFWAKAYLFGILPLFLFSLISGLRNLNFIPDYGFLTYKTRLLSIAYDAIVVFFVLAWQVRKLSLEKENQVKIAMENQLKLYEEKERISKDLHDSVGSQLTIVSTGLDNAIYLQQKDKLQSQRLEKLMKMYEMLYKALEIVFGLHIKMRFRPKIFSIG